MRITKDPAVRKREIIETAKRLFEENGYNETKVIDITRAINVAKGTFYHYFASKEDVLEEIVNVTLEGFLMFAEQVKADTKLSGLEKINTLLFNDLLTDEVTQNAVEYLEIPSNRELQEKTAVATINRLTPYIVLFLEQGVKEGTVLKSDYLTEKVQLILSASHFLIDSGLFPTDSNGNKRRRYVIMNSIEVLFGIKEGTFSKAFLID
ncbi:TetR/AcrR family transcriptional regulator [Candidatus Izemoplasma sp. B36]|uniref:TetR/AcrR family transcriptional regulator n=1 Tax=Candidatus Izemoplasma sp. B36 TaxID=3242468 RepID=UPI0035583D54